MLDMPAPKINVITYKYDIEICAVCVMFMEQIMKGRELLMMIAGGKIHTFDDILALPEGERAELIDGEIFMMASPTRGNQDVVTWLSGQIYNYIQNKKGKCRVYVSGFAVLPKEDNINYVEPDVTVVCDRNKKLYQESGVEEYWIVDPEKIILSGRP